MKKLSREPILFSEILQKIDQGLLWLSDRPHVNAMLWFLMSVAMYGIRAYGDYFAISKNPFTVQPDQIGFQDGLLLPLLAYFLGLNSRIQSYLILCFIILLVAFFVYSYLPGLTYGKVTAAIVLIAFALHPLLLVEFNVLGNVDGVTLIVSAMLLFTYSPILLLLSGLIGVMNHPIMLIIAPLIIVLRLAASDRKFTKSLVLSIIAGTLLGYIFVHVFLNYYSIVGDYSRFSLMFLPGVGYWINLKLKELPQSAFTLYGGLILIIISCLIYGFRRRPIFYLTFIGVQIVALIVTLFTFDTTRVFGLLTLPSVLLCIAVTAKLAQKNPDDYRLLRIVWLTLLLSAIFMPRYYASGGEILLPATNQFWKSIIN